MKLSGYKMEGKVSGTQLKVNYSGKYNAGYFFVVRSNNKYYVSDFCYDSFEALYIRLVEWINNPEIYYQPRVPDENKIEHFTTYLHNNADCCTAKIYSEGLDVIFEFEGLNDEDMSREYWTTRLNAKQVNDLIWQMGSQMVSELYLRGATEKLSEFALKIRK